MESKTKLLIAIDSFKGSLSSLEAATIIEKGFKKIIPELIVKKIPFADGGEGTVEAIVEALEGEYVEIKVRDPLNRTINAKYGVVHNGTTAVIEMAAASGITHLTDTEKNPLKTTTYGTGQLIKDAISRGCSKIVLGIGGSATNEGGIGMASALGAKFIDVNGEDVELDGESLSKLASVDLSEMDTLLENIEVITLCDVNNPLCGEEGASYIYGPQKGATKEKVLLLDKNLSHFAEVIEKKREQSFQYVPGTGAAGGLGFGAIVFLNSSLVSGTKYLMELLKLNETIEQYDIVITGEGKIDSQTKYDKLPAGIAKLAKKHNKFSICIAGGFGEGVEEYQDVYFDKMYSIVSKEISVEESMNNANEHLGKLSEEIAKELFKD